MSPATALSPNACVRSKTHRVLAAITATLALLHVAWRFHQNAAILHPPGTADLNHAVAAWRAHDTQTALAAFHAAAAKGNPTAELDLGILFLQGEAVPKDPAQAMAWFQQAAAGNDSRAEAAIGDLFHTGQGTKVDLQAAVIWYTQAAHHGDPAAALALAHLYDSTALGPPREDLAVTWLREAVKSHDVAAEIELARHYAQGIGLRKDPGEADYLLEKAGKARDPASIPK